MNTSEPVAAGSPPRTPAQRRFGSTEGAISLILAEGITRHTQTWSFAIVCSRVQRPCRQLSSSEQVSYRSFPHECENELTSLFLLSKSNPLHWASICFGTDDRGCPYTALVLTFKIEKRQTFTVKGSIHGNASVPRSFGFTIAWPDGDFCGNSAETDRFANGWTVPI